jgi:hypothetical protein
VKTSLPFWAGAGKTVRVVQKGVEGMVMTREASQRTVLGDEEVLADV